MASQAVTQQVDAKKVEEFAMKALGDVAGAVAVGMCTIGDRLGLFKAMARTGPVTAEDLAHHTGIHARYAREWLSALACAGYVEHDPRTGRFTLPPEHAPVLAQEAGPVFFGGFYQQFPAFAGVLDRVMDAFRDGKGVPLDAYPPEWWAGMERFTNGFYENLLLPVWIEAVPDVKARLGQGIRVADLGSGSGRALIKLAQAFPRSRFVGYDVLPSLVARANAAAREAGVSDRVEFRVRDVQDGLPERYDFITTFDVLHDLAHPGLAADAVRKALAPGGAWLVVEVNVATNLEDSKGPIGTIQYGGSTLYCLSASLANDGEGVGQGGFPEPRVREVLARAGFSKVTRLPLENPFQAVYDVRA